MRALKGASGSPVGDGTLATTASKIGFIPIPSLALASKTSPLSTPRSSATSSCLRSGSAPGRSILLTTGIISKFASNAKNKLDKV